MDASDANGAVAPPSSSEQSFEKGRGRYKDLYRALENHEQDFVRVSLRTGDYQEGAREAGHKNPLDLLSRPQIREAVLAAAPFCSPELVATLVKPYILQNLINEALGGNVPASKVLLELGAKGPKPKKVTYSSRMPGRNSAGQDNPKNPGAENDAE